MNKQNHVPMDFSDERLEHFLDLVEDQDLWPAFRYIFHYHRLTLDYLTLRRYQVLDFPIQDPEIEVEMELLKEEILKVFQR